MELKELLTSQGIEADKVDSILAAMKENKIFIAGQENLDIRYDKLKQKHDDLTIQIATANATIEELKKNNTDNISLQESLDKYKTDYENLQKESDTKIRNYTLDTQIKAMMKENKVKDKYDELLMSKINRDSLEIDDKGTVKGLKVLFNGLKNDYADLFVVDNLSGNPPTNNGSSANNTSVLAEQIRASLKR